MSLQEIPVSLVPAPEPSLAPEVHLTQPRKPLPEEIDPFADKLDAESKKWVEHLEEDFPGWPIQFHYAVISNFKRHGKEFFTDENMAAIMEKYKNEPRPVCVQPELKLERVSSQDAAKYFPPQESIPEDASGSGPAIEAEESAAE